MHGVGLLGVKKSTAAAGSGQDRDSRHTRSGPQGAGLLVLQEGARSAAAGRPYGGQSKEAVSSEQARVERLAGKVDQKDLPLCMCWACIEAVCGLSSVFCCSTLAPFSIKAHCYIEQHGILSCKDRFIHNEGCCD